MTRKKIGGIYLVIDPSVEKSILLDKVEQALEGGVNILQVWSHWPERIRQSDKEEFIGLITDLAKEYKVPVLINNAWQLLKSTHLDGVHFDTVPGNIDEIKNEVGRDFMTGITCSNDLDVVRWADENSLDYISFCAMFPSPSVGSCEIVSAQTVQKACKITDLPLFLSGGITPEKIEELDELDFNGVAVISGILKEDKPRKRASDYQKALKSKGPGDRGKN